VGRPNGVPSMYNAHSTYSSAFLSSVVESISAVEFNRMQFNLTV
jgi:hypothetical protein